MRKLSLLLVFILITSVSFAEIDIFTLKNRDIIKDVKVWPNDKDVAVVTDKEEYLPGDDIHFTISNGFNTAQPTVFTIGAGTRHGRPQPALPLHTDDSLSGRGRAGAAARGRQGA